MTVFDNYSKYYDLLYFDKDYKAEVKYINNIIKKYNPDALFLLELGCGTGIHAELLSQEGYTIYGIDISQSMLDKALKICNKNLSFYLGDIRTYRVNRKFDAVISIFHVASYQTETEDLIKYFKTAREHLNKDGLFIFDCWWGPAVLSQKPEKRVKRLENDEISIVRHANPVIYPSRNVVDVNYEIKITDKKTGVIESINEIHSMRYLFTPEIKFLLKQCGLKPVHSEEWLSSKDPGFDTWGVCFIVKAE